MPRNFIPPAVYAEFWENVKNSQNAVQALRQTKVDTLLSERADLNDNMKDLLKQRYEAASIAAGGRFQDLLAGRGILHICLDSTLRMYEAERALSDKKVNQSAALERNLAILKEIEKVCQERFDGGRIALFDLAMTRPTRLDVEIALEQLKSKQ